FPLHVNVPAGLPKFEAIAAYRSPSATEMNCEGVYARKLLAVAGTTAPSGGRFSVRYRYPLPLVERSAEPQLTILGRAGGTPSQLDHARNFGFELVTSVSAIHYTLTRFFFLLC